MYPYKTRSLNLAFIVREGDLRSLDQLLSQFKQPCIYKATTQDNFKFECPDLEAFLKTAKLSRTPIKSLEISTASKQQVPRVEMNLGNRPFSWSNTIEYRVYGPASDVLYMDRELDKWISGVKSWFSKIATSDPTVYFLWLLLAGLLGVILLFFGSSVSTRPVLISLKNFYLFPPTKFIPIGTAMMTILITPLSMFGMFFASDTLFPRLFPKIVFSLKEEERETKRPEWIALFKRAIIFILGLLLSLIMSILANLLTPK